MVRLRYLIVFSVFRGKLAQEFIYNRGGSHMMKYLPWS
jgi:hypothetical protein